MKLALLSGFFNFGIHQNPCGEPLDFLGKLQDTTFLSSAAPGWQVRWTLSPGERLALSVFPPRPFDWEKSFQSRLMLTFAGLPTTVYQDHYQPAWFDIPILWDFIVRGYGMSWGPHAVPAHEGRLRAHLDAIRAAGMTPIPYFSAYFYYSRDPQEWVQEAARWQQEYGVNGLYSDGLPDQEWLVAYEEMRLARELFPDGDLIVHTTGQSFNGGPPLALADIFMPFIDTYATATVRGEWIRAQGRDWPYPRYVSSQYRKANCIGIQKGDRWEDVPQSEQDALNLLYNGRAWYTSGPYDPPVLKEWSEGYLPKLQALRELWEEKGQEADFFERYFLPRCQEEGLLPYRVEMR